ncbi:MAG: FTR1 family protein [Betaproteobacteria bacterium]|nr:FTR1 family protein [Betaproteobacteria bacterium]
MLGSAIIVFRETLEAALIVAIVMGASRGVVGRGRWVAGGVALGIVGALVVALFAGAISEAVQGRGQELFNAGVLLAAVAMLAWHNVWMSSHARKHVEEMRHLGHDVKEGAKPLSAVLVVTAVAVLREGSETVLFLYGLLASGGRVGLAAGAVAGLAAGAAVGVLLYFGLLRIPLRHFFTVTGAIVLLLASGLAASAAGYLTQAGLLPPLVDELWNSSWLLSENSIVGHMLHVLIGYSDRPTGIQMLFYGVTLVTILALMRIVGARAQRLARSAAASAGSPA